MSEDAPKRTKQVTLASTAVVTFDYSDTTLNDTPTTDPVVKWLRVFPTATETAPD